MVHLLKKDIDDKGLDLPKEKIDVFSIIKKADFKTSEEAVQQLILFLTNFEQFLNEAVLKKIE